MNKNMANIKTNVANMEKKMANMGNFMYII